MRKLIHTALALTALMSIGVARANYDTTLAAFFNRAERCLAVKNWTCATENAKRAEKLAGAIPVDLDAVYRAFRLRALAGCYSGDEGGLMGGWRMLSEAERSSVTDACRGQNRSGVVARALVGFASNAYDHGDYDEVDRAIRKALDIGDFSLRASVDLTKAYEVFGASACFRKDAATAELAWSHLADVNKDFLAYVCRRNGIVLGKSATKKRD